MRVCRSVLIAVVIFVAGFSLAVGSLWSRTCQQDISRLHGELSAAIEARNHAQDSYDSIVYRTLFRPPVRHPDLQLSLGTGAEDPALPVEFLVHDVPSSAPGGEEHGLR